MMKRIRHKGGKVLFLSILMYMVIGLSYMGCGGGGGDGGSSHPPSISNLDFSPSSATLNEGGGSITITGFVDFVDNGGDISSVTIKAWDMQSTLVTDITIPVSGTGTSGTLQGLVTVDTTTGGYYDFEIFCTDSEGSTSNTLSGIFTVGESLSTTGYGNLRLYDDSTGIKSYVFNIQITNPAGSMLTDPGLIQDVKLYENSSMTEVSLTGSWELWYSPMYIDSDGNGSNLPYSRPWSQAQGSPTVSIGNLSTGFYRGVVTDSFFKKHDIWLYYEPPAETGKVMSSSMSQTNNPNGSVTLSWTNPVNIDPTKHVIRLYVRTTEDSGDGFDDTLLIAHLPASTNSYTLPSSEVVRLKSYTGLYWFVQIRHLLLNLTNPDATTKSYFIYRNYGETLPLGLP